MSIATVLLTLALAPFAGAQSVPPTEGFDALSPSGQGRLLQYLEPEFHAVCDNLLAVGEMNKVFQETGEQNPCVSKMLNDSSMFEYALDEAKAKCRAFAKNVVVTSRKDLVDIKPKRADLAGFAREALAPLIKVNCR